MALNTCKCGGQPKYHAVQVSEDAVESWVECPKCSASTEPVEDAYGDYPTAEWLWNRGRLKEPSQ